MLERQPMTRLGETPMAIKSTSWRMTSPTASTDGYQAETTGSDRRYQLATQELGSRQQVEGGLRGRVAKPAATALASAKGVPRDNVSIGNTRTLADHSLRSCFFLYLGCARDVIRVNMRFDEV